MNEETRRDVVVRRKDIVGGFDRDKARRCFERFNDQGGVQSDVNGHPAPRTNPSVHALRARHAEEKQGS